MPASASVGSVAPAEGVEGEEEVALLVREPIVRNVIQLLRRLGVLGEPEPLVLVPEDLLVRGALVPSHHRDESDLATARSHHALEIVEKLPHLLLVPPLKSGEEAQGNPAETARPQQQDAPPVEVLHLGLLHALQDRLDVGNVQPLGQLLTFSVLDAQLAPSGNPRDAKWHPVDVVNLWRTSVVGLLTEGRVEEGHPYVKVLPLPYF